MSLAKTNAATKVTKKTKSRLTTFVFFVASFL